MVIALWLKFFQETNWFSEFDFTKIQNDQLWDFEEAEKSNSYFVLMRNPYNVLGKRENMIRPPVELGREDKS